MVILMTVMLDKDDDGDVGDDGMIYERFLEPDGQHGLMVLSGDPQVALWILLQ